MPTIIKTFTSSQGGVKNYLSTRSSSFSGWTNVGTGATGSTTTTAAELPELSVGTALKVTNGGSGSGYVESDFFQVDASDLGKLLGLTYNLETSTSPAYAANNFQIQVWDATTSGGTYAQNTTLNVANIPSSPTGGTMQLSFSQNPSRPFTRIRIVRAAGLANSWASFSSITVTSATGGQGAAIGPGVSYTPASSISNATTDFKYWREGENMLVAGTIKWSNTGSMSGLTAAQIFPSGLTVKPLTDSASGLGAGVFNLGPAVMEDFGTQSYNGFIRATYTDSSNAFTSISFSNVTSGGAGAPFTPGANDVVTFSCKVRVSEWAGNGTVNLGPGAQVEFVANNGTTWDASNTSDFTNNVYGPNGSAMGGSLTADRSKRVRFQYPIQSDDMITLELSRGDNVWMPASSATVTNGAVLPGMTGDGTATAGVTFTRVSGSTTDIDVYFGRYIYIANDDAPTANWNSSDRWRVRKAKASSPVGFGKSNSNEFGLVAPRRGQQALTVTSSVAGWTTTRAVGVYYQDQDGNHRLKFNLYGTNSSGSRTGCTLTISGVTFKNVSNFYQPCAFMTDSAATPTQAYTNPNASTLGIVHSSATTTYYGVSGDVELDSKPTWA